MRIGTAENMYHMARPMNGPDPRLAELPAQAFPGWLDMLARLMPDTVKVEVSPWLVLVALAALWIWRGG